MIVAGSLVEGGIQETVVATSVALVKIPESDKIGFVAQEALAHHGLDLCLGQHRIPDAYFVEASCEGLCITAAVRIDAHDQGSSRIRTECLTDLSYISAVHEYPGGILYSVHDKGHMVPGAGSRDKGNRTKSKGAA